MSTLEFHLEIDFERLLSWLVFGLSASGKSSSGGETARAAGVIMLLVAFGIRLIDYTNLADRYNPGADLCPQAFKTAIGSKLRSGARFFKVTRMEIEIALVSVLKEET